MRTDRVPAGPFVAVLRGQLREVNGTLLGTDELAARLGVSVRTVYRWTRQLDEGGHRVDTFQRSTVEDMLARLDLRFDSVYPDVPGGDPPVEPDAYCRRCQEIVSPISGACPWCDGETSPDLPERMYCKREDAMRFPAVDGACCRCAGKLTPQIPRVECACGCGTEIPKFHAVSARLSRYHIGHRGQTQGTLPAAPFAAWLRGQLDRMDLVEAVARQVGLPRDLVVGLLSGKVTEVDRRIVNKGLRIAATQSVGRRRFIPRPGPRARIADLYPGRDGKRVCPACGDGKSPQAQMCYRCRSKQGKPRATSLTPEVLAEARRLRDQGLKWDAVARAVRPRTRYTSISSARACLIREFDRRGWLDSQQREAA